MKDIFLFKILAVTLNPCSNLSPGYCSLWTSGQMLSVKTKSPFYWKPYSDVLISFGTHNYWAAGQPNFHLNQEFCVIMWKDFLLADEECRFKYCVVCETPQLFK